MANMQIVPANCSKNVEAQYVEMMVPLYSHGCEKKVKKALSSLRGIYSVNVDYYQQKVIVWGICNKYDVLKTIKTKRKEARFWNQEDNGQLIMMQQEEKSQPPSQSPPPPPPKNSKPSLTLMRVRSLSLKLSLKRVFTRSFSF